MDRKTQNTRQAPSSCWIAFGPITARAPGVLLRCWIVLCLVLTATIPLRAQQLTSDEVKLAIAAGVRYLRGAQLPEGGWRDYGQIGGTTALATLALFNAGVAPDEEWMQRAVNAVRRINNQQTYTAALKISALAAIDPKKYQPEIKQTAQALIAAQHPDGMWGYRGQQGRADFSNTQFALLGLHEASAAGIQIPRSVWRKAETAWLRAQLQSGSWPYVPDSQQGTGSMTAAGLASLYITGNSLAQRTGRKFDDDGRAPCCGGYAQFRPIARGLAWLGENFSASRNPPQGSWYFYYLYGIERVGILSGIRFFGPHDWYRQGAARLRDLQNGDGSWREHHDIADTSFALLFLAKGRRPLLFNKLQWSQDQAWNLRRNDLAHLVSFIGDRLGEPVSWEIVSLDQEVSEWLRAPILFFNGHDFPPFDEQAIAKLKEYVAQGGTVFAEACCSQEPFRDGFRLFTLQAFSDYELLRLPANHPVFRSMFQLNGSEIELYGIDIGCRTGIFFSPRDLSCPWEQADIPDVSERAFQIGANIAAYATGNEPLPDKLEVAVIAARAADEGNTESPPRGAVHIAQLIHNGDWQPQPLAIPKLARLLHEQFAVDVVPACQPLKATGPKLRQHPIVYIAGNFSFELTPAEVDALRTHLTRGGFLFADTCCGRKAFDESMRVLAAELFPDHPMERLPQDHPIIAGMPGFPLPEVSYLPAVQKEMPELNTVWLEGVTIAGRTVLVHSPFAIGYALEDHACFGCRGVASEDARKLAANIILYTLSY